jgi:integrase/recombinase XerD
MKNLSAPVALANTDLVLPVSTEQKHDSLLYWVTEYWETRVVGSPAGTVRGKRDDLQLFLSFFATVVATDYVDDWTPSLSKAFKAWLQNAEPQPARKHAKAYAPSSINRMLATLRHFAKFIQDRRNFEAGFPFDGVKDITLEEPEWNGLTDLELMRVRSAIDQVTKLSTRANQSPKRDRACAILTLATGLRSFEIEGLDYEQYQGKYLRNVKGKGENYRDKYISKDARCELDDYINSERGTKPRPLFMTRRRGRLLRSQMDRFLKKVAAHANAKLPADQRIHLHAHKLRHTSVKKVHDKKGPLETKSSADTEASNSSSVTRHRPRPNTKIWLMVCSHDQHRNSAQIRSDDCLYVTPVKTLTKYRRKW